MAKHTIYKINAGKGNKFALDFFRDKFIGIDFPTFNDLSEAMDAGSDKLKRFCDKQHRSSNVRGLISAEKAYEILNMFCLEMNKKDIVICPDGRGNFAIGEVRGEYRYTMANKNGRLLPLHRRRVNWWLDDGVAGRNISAKLRKKLSSSTWLANLSEIRDKEIIQELDELVSGKFPNTEIYAGYLIDSETVMEEHICAHWDKCSLGRSYDLIKPDHELLEKLSIKPGKKYTMGAELKTEVGAIDLLAISNTGKELLVIELKKKKNFADEVGNVLCYMGYLKNELGKKNIDIHVKGCIISDVEDHTVLCALNALEELKHFKTAEKVIEGIDFYRYEILSKDLSDFNLIKIDVAKAL